MKRSPNHAFTLIELMVVLGIITVLISILLPAIMRVREQANRAACAANLRTLGQAAHIFASNNKGDFPGAYMIPPGYAYAPFWSWDDWRVSSLGSAAASGDKLGLPLKGGWDKLGVTVPSIGVQLSWNSTTYSSLDLTGPTNLRCPSSKMPIHYSTIANNPSWGRVMHANYFYVGRYRPAEFNGSTQNWGTFVPARTNNDPNLSQRILGGDEVSYAGFRASNAAAEGYYGTYAARINHMSRDDKPAFQNLLFGDGHVEGFTASKLYNTATWPTTDYSLAFNNTIVFPGGGYLYWGRKAP